MGHTASLLQMAGICKSFGSAQVLREVDLRLDAGEVLALLGANGAGKSTLVKILCGVYSRDAGTVRLDDQAVRYERPEEAIAHGVRFLPQEVSILPDLTVAENILIADLPRKRSWLGNQVDRPALRTKSAGTARPARLRSRSRCAGTPALRAAQAPSRDRPRPCWPSAGHRHGRANRFPRRSRGPSALRRGRAAQGAADRHHLHLSLPRRGFRDRRPDHRAPRRAKRRRLRHRHGFAARGSRRHARHYC